MKFFVYGKLKSDQVKSHLIPFSRSYPYVLYGYRMFLRHTGTAGMRKCPNPKSYVIGEMRETSWTEWPIIGRLLKMLLLFVLDMNEGTYWGVYERVNVGHNAQTYVYKGDLRGCPTIVKWPTSIQQ